MDDLRIIYGTGAGIFGVSALITGIIFVYFVCKGRIADNSATDHVHWLHSIWIYLLLFTEFLLMASLYATNAVGYGFYVKSNLHVINVVRWLSIAIVGSLFQVCLAYIMTNDHRTWNNKKKKTHIGAQNFFIILYYAMSQLSIFFATITVNRNAHILGMVASLVCFIISVLLYFFPSDKISIDEGTVIRDNIFTSRNLAGAYTRKIEESIMATYRIAFLVIIILTYVINFIIWFLSRSNDMSEAVSLNGEAITYLVSDFLLLVPFSAILIGFTIYYKMKTIAVKNNVTKEVTFAQKNRTEWSSKK